MRILNRLIALIALLLVIAAGSVTAVNTLAGANRSAQALREDVVATVAQLTYSPALMSFGQRLPVVAVAALVALIGFLLLILELRSMLPSDQPNIRVKGADGSETVITRSAVLQRVEFAVDKLDDVVTVRPKVTGKGASLAVELDVTTTPFVDVPLKTEEIRAVVRDVVEQQMGLVLKRVAVRLDHQKFREAMETPVG